MVNTTCSIVANRVLRNFGRRTMNANELADRLDKISYDCTIEEWRASPVGEAATKLRQQQESIEGLNRDYDLLFAKYQLLLKNTRGQK